MNPVEEFLAFDSGGLEKTAQSPIGWAARHPMAATAAIGVATPLAVMALQEGYGEIKNLVGRSMGFKRMMDYNPGLKKLPADKAKAMFNTLHNAAPDLAKDPVVASSWVNRMALQDEYVDPRTMADLGAAQKNIGRPGTEFPVAALTTGMMGTVGTGNAAALKAQEIGLKRREYDLKQAQNTASSLRDAAAGRQDQEKYKEWKGGQGVRAAELAEKAYGLRQRGFGNPGMP